MCVWLCMSFFFGLGRYVSLCMGILLGIGRYVCMCACDCLSSNRKTYVHA